MVMIVVVALVMVVVTQAGAGIGGVGLQRTGWELVRAQRCGRRGGRCCLGLVCTAATVQQHCLAMLGERR